MQRTENISLTEWAGTPARVEPRASVKVFAAILLAGACLSAAVASWLPLQTSIVTVFLFAGPHNWFEARYFLMRLPARFGRSRSFFIVAFAGIGLLTIAYVSLPALYYFNVWSGANWPNAIAIWNTVLLLWISALVLMRGRQKANRDWFWVLPLACVLCSLNWLAPEMFSLAIVYLHPLVALWFFDRHLRRTKPEWLAAYRRCLFFLPLLLAVMLWQLSRTASLTDDNGLFWRITQHAGASLLPGVSSHMLVSTHVFLELLHYGVWILALPLIGASGAVWSVKSIPIANHSRGFPRLVAAFLICGLIAVLVLWFGFATNYSLTRDVYFAVAMAHVLAEAPFLLRMI
jgi:hypothetical protein